MYLGRALRRRDRGGCGCGGAQGTTSGSVPKRMPSMLPDLLSAFTGMKENEGIRAIEGLSLFCHGNRFHLCILVVKHEL